VSHDADRQALLAYLYRALDLLPGVPPSMYRTLQTSCLKTIRRLEQQEALSPGEVYHLKSRARAPYPERIDHD
jgi:predicted RecB family nuclease